MDSSQTAEFLFWFRLYVIVHIVLSIAAFAVGTVKFFKDES